MQVSVVVPVGPGDKVSPHLMLQLEALPPEAELIVIAADELAHDLARPGRAVQQNLGAQRATREWLWFLHADSALAPETLSALSHFIRRGENAFGYFDLYFLDDGPPLTRLNALGARLRSRWFRLPFGDQGFVLPRAVFEELGGFDTTIQRGEDHELVWRVRRASIPLRPIGAKLYTSARKYATNGWLATTQSHIRETWRQAQRFRHKS